MKKKRLGEIPALQKQMQEMGISKEVIEKESDAVVWEFDGTTKKGRAEARKALFDDIKKRGLAKHSIMLGDPIPEE